ncbi:hypothetical protein N7509_006520 [Penicillium cosmopolitanum]|uniref:Uncharacterized protein n=1 Tax=Penicillium cosmopolitanum TaxID=1131564 RepID=A0A9W9W0L4_9EURO|nr:uncharacterized protein N7509_006520 [Penicillium cosmopolitanum]KAJ5394733.1 hypothetical protein N7509_006520 [Penicillium cosmopolitanum]
MPVGLQVLSQVLWLGAFKSDESVGDTGHVKQLPAYGVPPYISANLDGQCRKQPRLRLVGCALTARK